MADEMIRKQNDNLIKKYRKIEKYHKIINPIEHRKITSLIEDVENMKIVEDKLKELDEMFAGIKHNIRK